MSTSIHRKEKFWKLWNRDGGICQICKKPIKFISQATMDHIIPKSKGGHNSFENLQLSHSSCNNDKGNNLNFEIMINPKNWERKPHIKKTNSFEKLKDKIIDPN